MKITEAIRAYLDQYRTGLPEFGIKLHNDPSLLDRWHPGMEVQLQADPSMGEPVEGKTGTFTDGLNRYWSIRIPRDAGTNPSFEDREIGFAPVKYSISLGLTGWNWVDRTSLWVGYDYDSMIGHAEGVGIPAEELARVKDAATQLPWVEVRNSTGGVGTHLYVPLDAIPTANHHEHAALARVVLGMMSQATGFDFASRVDKAGGILWIASKKSTTANGGLKLVKAATQSLTEADLPPDWRTPTSIPAGQTTTQPTTANHQRDLNILSKSPCPPQPVDGHPGMYRVHTSTLDAIDPEFQTISPGTRPSEQNGYMVPSGHGAWKVYSFASHEHETWTHPRGGKPHTTLNRHLEIDWASLPKNELNLVTTDKYANIQPVPLSRLRKDHPVKAAPLIDGLIRIAEVMNIIASPKVGKSWLVYYILLSIVTGRPIFGFPTKKGRTMLIDNELKAATIWDRIDTVARAMGIAPEEYEGMIDVSTLRGNIKNLREIEEGIVNRQESGKYVLMVVDSLYRTNPGGSAGENDNGAMTLAYNDIDRMAERLQAGVILIHHASKGNQSEKSVTDVGSGAGSQSRAADAHVVLRDHVDDNCVVMEAKVRSFAPAQPRVLKWEHPLWSVVPDADPTALQSQNKKASANKAEQHRKHIIKAITDQPDSASSLKLRLKGMIPRDDIPVLLSQLVVEGVLTVTPGKKANNRCDIYSVTA